MVPTTAVDDFKADIEKVGRINAVPTILDVVRGITGMRFVAVARVTEDRWVACSVLDEIDFGLKPGGALRIETTICNEIRECRKPVIIDHVEEDEDWRNHPTPAMYGFQSYISMPIILGDGTFFGTLCAIDPRPARVNTPHVIGMFRLFADLIAKQLDAQVRLSFTELALKSERAESELREIFMAVLAHDLRAPMCSINTLTELMMQTRLEESAISMGILVRQSAVRMVQLIENMLDLARGRLSGGLPVALSPTNLEPVLHAILSELHSTSPENVVKTEFLLGEPVRCDSGRISQLFSNLLGNAFIYGTKDKPIRVRAVSNSEEFELSVANSGEPIPKAALEQLFRPFYRNAVSHNREGLGLGLYIAHEIAVAHSGTLTVESAGDETCFTFRMRHA